MIRLSFFLLLFTPLLSLANSEKVFKVRLISDVQTFDWNIANTAMETYLMTNIMEGLVGFDEKMRVIPLLAESWNISKDRTKLTFRLKKNILWSDGKQLTAQDFAYSWKRLLSPLTAAPYAYILFDIVGASEFNSGKISDFSKVGIKAVNSHQLEIRLKKPVTFFLQKLTFWVTYPIRQDIVESLGPRWAVPKKSGNQEVVVLGPFIPTEYNPGSSIVLKRNNKYWGKKPETDRVVFKVVEEDSTALNLFKANELDFVRPLHFLEVKKLKKDPAFHSVPYFRTAYLEFNTTHSLLNDVRIRKAIAMAVEHSLLTKVLQQDKIIAHSFIPPILFPEGKNTEIKFNLKEAKRLLKEGGVSDHQLSGIEIVTYASEENAQLLQFIQETLYKNLGLRLSVRMLEYKSYRNQLDLLNGGIFYSRWGADYADPDTFFSVYTSTSGNNHSGWKNKTYDTLIEKAMSTPDGPERIKLYKEALEILIQKDVVLIPIYFDSLEYLLNPKVKNFVINPLNYIYFKNLSW